MRQVCVIIAFVAMCCSGEAFAEASASKPAPAEKAAPMLGGPPALTAADVSAFVDGIVPVQLSRADIAGAVVAVVKDGEVIFAKGYGFADAAAKKSVTPATLFRIGSVSKLFTWTAVMQQVEAGKLDLDRDINGYLDFVIPPAFGKPVTLRHIMTHTPGFEDTAKELFVRDVADMEPLGRYLTSHIPRRIFPPGEVPAYSNYATALAGYIVERAVGVPLEQYIDERIIRPLGMRTATFHQPLSKELEALMSKGYRNASDPPIPFEIVQAWPAGSVSASAMDMSRFILAFLGQGRTADGAQILQPETVQAMHARNFGVSEALNGMALGFYEESRNGQRIIGHGGDTQAFHTDLHLVPALNLGFFVSYNSGGRAQVSGRSELWEALFDRYYPASLPTPAAASTVTPATLAGSYMSSRRVEGAFFKTFYGIAQFVVKPQADGTLIIDGLNRDDGQPRRWKADGGNTFRATDGASRVAFENDGGGGTTLAIDFPFMVFQRVPWYLGKSFIVGVGAASIVVLLLTVLAWPIAAMIRRRYGRSLNLAPAERRVRLWSRLAAVLWLAVLGAWVAFIAKGLNDIGMLSRRTDGLVLALETATILACVLSLIPMWHALKAWTGRRWIWSRLYESLVALACAGLTWLAVWGNLAKLGTRY